MPEGVKADLEMKAIDAIANGEDCPDCGATWTTPEPEGGVVAANMVMYHKETCVLFVAAYTGKVVDETA